MTTHDTQLQYIPASEFLTDAKIAVLGYQLVKDDPRHQHHDMRERKKAKARRSYSVDVTLVPEIEVRHG